jgi:predicted metal-binding membrane protein
VLTEQSRWLSVNSWVLGAGILVLAGIYQFTPLKYHCLDKCRSPLSFIMGHWTGKSERTQALRLGLHHGIFCIGCCWSLMLLMFAVGSGNIGWMLILGTLMAVEKNLSWGRRLSKPLGVLLLVWGVAIAAGARFLAL